MDQRQELGARLPRQLRGLPRGRVASLDRSLELVVSEAPIVHEQLGLMGGHPGHLARRGVPGDHDLAAAAGLAHDLLGANQAVAPRHGLAGLKPAEVGAGLDPQARRQLGVEAPRPLVLDQRVAMGANLMLDPEAAHLVAVVANRLALVELDQLDLVGDPAHDSWRASNRPEARAARRSAADARGPGGRRSSAAPATRGSGRRDSG